MKKIALVLIAMMGFVFVANAQQDKKSVPGDYNNSVIVSVSEDSQSSTSITFYNNSTKSLKVKVSILNDQGNEVGNGWFNVPGAPEQGSHSTTTGTVSKISTCRNPETTGCEVKGIRIKEVKPQN